MQVALYFKHNRLFPCLLKLRQFLLRNKTLSLYHGSVKKITTYYYITELYIYDMKNACSKMHVAMYM